MDLRMLMQAVPAGEYVSVVKTLVVLVVLLGWLRLLTWVDKDAPAAKLPRQIINMGMLGGCVLAFVLLLVLPGFAIGFSVFLLVFLAEVGGYIAMRNQKVGLKDLKGEMLDNLKVFKPKGKEIKVGVDLVQFIGKNGSLMAAPAAESPERAAYDVVQTLLAEPLIKGMERLDMVSAEKGATVRYYVDGVGYNSSQFSREDASAAIAFLKGAAKLDVEEKRKPQKGSLRVSFNGKRTEMQIQTAGNRTGEQLRVIANVKTRHNFTLEKLGFTSDQLKAMEELIAAPEGIVLLATPKGEGLTTLLYTVIRRHDAFLSQIQTLEREPEEDLEGITQNTVAANAPTTEELQKVQWLASQEPEVIVVDEIQNPQSAAVLIKYASTGKRVYVGLRATGTMEALSMWRKLVGDEKLAMSQVKMIVAGRLVRRLCGACKVAFQPDPDTLRKLNMDPQRVTELFQARKQPMTDPKGNPIPCEFCHNLRFQGRFGIYEFLNIDEDIREAIAKGGSSALLKSAFRKQRGRYLQELALATVENGETSVQEVLRVLKSETSHASAKAAPAAPAQPGA